MEKKVGIYICTGCGIGEALDTEKLSKVAAEYNVAICKTHPFLCSEEGAELVKKDIGGEGVNTIVIAACSPRVNYDVFSYNSSVILERINLREQVVWCHAPKDEDTQMLAEDCLRMGIVKARKSEPPVPYGESINKTILVVGGGITGMTAANEAGKAGYEVVLVEKNQHLGGWMTRLYKQYPKHSPHRDLEEIEIQAKIKEIKENPRIKIFTSAEIEEISGAPGMFDVTIKQNGSATTVKVGSIVLATGWKPYDATKLDNLGFGKYKNVITNVMMEELASKGKIIRPSDGKEVKSVAFVQCAGSRDEKHLPYCSSVCCLVSLKQAMYLREQDKDSKVYIFYKDMRTPAQYEDFYKRVQEEEGVFFTKGEVTGISEDPENNLVVEVDNTLLGGKIKVKADLVVLATGMVPTTMPDEKKADVAPDSGFYGAPILHLQYRQGPEIPTLKYDFPDSHFICFPYETRRTGIYAAGCIRQPMDAALSIEDAAGAALKAIQCVEMTSRGESVHPRAGDLSYPEIYMQGCTQCKRCTEECPFGMYNEDEKFNPLPNPTRCRRCGICMGACPPRVISFKNYSVDMIGSMVKAIEVPGEEEEKPRVVVFVCENDMYPALDMVGINRLTYSPYVRIIPLRCLGSVNLVWLADALAKGIDGILLLGCKYGDDYQCHFIKGSELTNTRMEKIKETLDRLVLESERVRILQLSIAEYDKIPGIIDEFIEKIKEIGPNPYKGF